MADVNSNININFNTAAALAQLRQLQAGLSKFHQSLAEGNLAAANAQKGLNAQLLQSIGATGKFSASQVKVAGSTLAFTSALEKNKLSLREYYRYTMAAATANTRVLGRAFAQEREIINRARRDRVKALQAQYIQMNKANAGFMDAIRIMPKNLQMASGRFTELGTRIQYAAQRQQFLNQLLKQGSTQLLNFGKNTQWAGRQLMVGLTMPLALFGASAAKAFRELETEIVKFKRVYGDALTNDSETNAAVENIRKLATEYTKYGVSVTKTMEMASTAAAAGFAGTALNTQVETATKLAVLGQVEQQQALETTMSLQNAFGLSSEELAKKIDFLNAVENQTVLSIEDLTIAIPKAAPVIKQLGGSVEDLAFFMTAMKEGGINASEGANALKSGLASLINPSKKAAGFLADLGINVKGIVEANQGDIKATVIGFSQALDTLDPLNRARAIEQMFGKFQFARLSTLFQNVAKDGTQASRALDLAGSSVEALAILSEREMKKIEDSVGVKFQAAIEQFKQEIMPLGKAFLEALTPVVKFFGNLFEKFNGLSDQTKKVVAVIVGVVAGLGPVLLMTFGLLANGVANVIKFFAMLRGGVAKLNGQTKILGGGFNYVTQEQIENMASSQQLHQTHTKLIEVFNMEKTSVNALATSYNSLSTQMRTMAAQNPSLFAGGAPGAKRAVSKLPPVRKYAEGILSVPGPKGAGDVVPAMLSPGEAVIPTDTTNKYRGLISAMFQDKVPGFMAGRLPGGPGRGIPLSDGPAEVRKAQQAKYRRQNDARQGWNEPHPEVPTGPVFVGMPVSADKASQSRQILDKISEQVSIGRFGTMPPSNFGTKLQGFKGYSFPERGIGGVYRKPNGKIVVVKPTIDEKTALAEVRMTEIEAARGMVVPKQSIRTMIDPTDPTGQRKFIVIESPYDPRFAAMDGKFSKTDMVKQLVGSLLRGDRDLQKANVSGNRVPDVGNAGVMTKASGFRDYAENMPSFEEQAMINLLGVKGGARKDFALATAPIAANMTPNQYKEAVKGEIERTIPQVERVIKSWNLEPEEQVVYDKMLERLKVGAKVDWDKFQPVHARAGSGVVKAIKGIDPNALTPEIREQLSKYSLASVTQEQSMIDELKRKAQNALIARIAELDLEDPARGAVVKAAWEGGKAPIPPSMKEKAFSSPRQSSFLNEISQMTPVNVDGVTKYVHDVDMDEFSKDPNGRAKWARTQEEVINNLLYRMGATPGPNGYVAGGKFKGRFANPTEFLTDLRSTGKQSGSWKANVKKEFRKTLSAAEKAYNAEYANQRYLKMMTDAGLTPEQAKTELKAELSHTSKTGAPGRGPEKWLRGTGSFDSLIVNRYMNSQARLNNLLKWNKDNGYSLIPQDGIDKYYQAAAFMSKGGHPTNAYEASLVALAADVDLRALDNPAVPSDMKTAYTKEKLNALRALLGDKAGRGFYESATRYNFGAGNLKGLVLAKLGEYIYDKPKKTLEKITQKNAKKAPANVKASTGKASDNMVVAESPGRSVVTKAQAGRIASGRGVVVLPGKDKGDPSAVAGVSDDGRDRRILNPSERQGRVAADLRARGYSQNEIDRILRKVAKDEAKLAKSKAESVREQTAEQRKEDQERKRQSNEAKARFKEQQRISQLNYNQAMHYQDALDEDERRKLQTLKEKKKEATTQRRNLRAEKVGRFSGGAAMALGTAGTGLLMSGNTSGGMAMMGASAVAGMAPMLTNPVGAVAAGLLALAGTVYAFNAAMKKAREEGIALGKSMSMTNAKLIALSQITKTVSASEEADKKRADRLVGGNEKQRKVGQTILNSEFGKSLLADIETQSKAGRSSKEIGQNVGVQLSSAMLSGVITSEQARSMAMAIGNELKDYPMSANIVGEIIQITGPNGENIEKDPIKVALEIDKKTFKSSKKMAEWAAKQNFAESFVGKSGTQKDAASALRGEKGLKHQIMAGVNPYIYQDFFDPKKSGLDKTLSIVSMGLTSAYFQIRDANAQSVKLQTAGAQLMIQELANNQQLVDSLNKQYDIKLKTAKNEEEIATIEKDRKKALDDLNKQNKDQLNTILASKDSLGDTAWNAAIKASADELYKKGPMAAIKDTALTQLEGLQNSAFKTQMQLEFASGLIDPMTLIELLGNEPFQKEYNLLVDTTFSGNAAEASVVSQLLSKAGLKTQTKTIVLKLLNNDKDKYTNDELTGAVEALSQIQETYGIELDVNTNSMAKVQRIADMIKALKGKNKVTKVELEAMAIEDPRYKYIVDNWAMLVGDGKTISRTMLLNIETMVTDDKILNAYLQAAGTKDQIRTNELVQKGMIPSWGQQSTHEDAATYFAKNPSKLREILGLGDPVGDSGGSEKDPLDFLDNLAMGIKQVRDNAFNALKPIESLLAAFRDKKTQQNAFKLFDGIQNRLLNMGVSQEFRDAIASMSATDFAKVAALKKEEALFTFEKGKPRSKDTISGLTEKGMAVDQGYKERNLGDFNLANATTIKDIQNQTQAYKILISNGLNAAEALEVVADRGQAAAIASGAIKNGDPEWDNYINNIKTANTDLERQAVLNKAIKANEEFAMYKKMPELVSKMKELGYSTDQIDAVLGDPQLAKFLVEDLKDGKLDAKEIAETLNNIEARKIIDIQVSLNKGDLKEASDKGRDLVDDLFAAQEALIRTGPEAMQLKGNERQIRDLEAQIAPFQRQIEALNDEIEDGQRAIEKEYTRPIEDLNEEINDLNRELEMNPFFGDRAIKKIQDENNILSNDLEIINHAADEVNKRYDEQAEALSKVQEINQNILDQQKQQLGLADALTQGDISAAAQAAQDMRATSASQFASGQSDALEQARQNALGSLVGPQSGLTQEQITEKQFQNSQAIYRMETDPRRLEILDKIQLKQDKIYELEEKREAALRKIRDLEDKVYDIEENSIEPLQERIDALNYTNRLLQDSIDKQIEGLKVLGKTRDEWERINAMLDMDAATKRALAQSADLAALLTAAEELNLTWADILAKMAAYANGIPGAVQNARNAIGGIGADAYVAPQDTPESLAAFEEFLTVVEELDAATAALEDAYDKGQWAQFDSLQRRLAAAQEAYNKTLPVADPSSIGTGGGIGGKYGMLYQADGGFIPKGTDTVPAMLTPGEFVVRKSAVDQYGEGFLNDINVQRFSTGGTVGAPHGLGMSSMGSAKPKTKEEEKRATSLFDKKIWEKTANFFALPSIAKTALDIAKYGGIPQMFAAKAVGAPTQSSLKDNINAALAVAPVPGIKAVKPLINKISNMVPKSITESLGKNGIDIFNKLSKKANETVASKSSTSLVEERVVTPENYSGLTSWGAPKPTSPSYSKNDSLWGDDWGPMPDSSDIDWANISISPMQKVIDKLYRLGPIGKELSSKLSSALANYSSFKSPLKQQITEAWKFGIKEKTDFGYEPALLAKLGLSLGNKLKSPIASLSDSFNPKRIKQTPYPDRNYIQNSMLSTGLRGGDEGFPNRQYSVRQEHFDTASISNLFKNIGLDIVSPVTSTFKKVKNVTMDALSKKFADTPFGQNMATAKMAAKKNSMFSDPGSVDHYRTQAIIDSIPGGLGALIQMYRGVHRSGVPITEFPSPLERFIISKTDGSKTPINAYGPGLYSATSPVTSERIFSQFGPYQYRADLTPKAMLKVLSSKGFIKFDELRKFEDDFFAKTGEPGRRLHDVNADVNSPIVQELMKAGYLGYRHGDAFTNWGVGNIPGMNLKKVGSPSRESLVYSAVSAAPEIATPTLNQTQKIGTSKSLIAKASALVAGITGLSLFKTSEARADEYFPPKPTSAYDSDNKPTGSPTSRYWGELERLYQQSPLGFDTKGKPIFNDAGKDPWGGTEIPGLPFNGKVANFTDYFHQLAEQPKKSISNPMDVDKSLRPLVGSGASMGGIGNGIYGLQMLSKGGLVPSYFAQGGYASGTDIVPAMLTPGEFVMSKYAVQSHGADAMRAINNGSSVGDSVYNYSISVNVKSDANPDEIARVVMTQIKGIDSQKLRGNRL